ncbi:MAG: methyltransferase domain-containing protein [Jatrophihabitantaceae bacterium]
MNGFADGQRAWIDRLGSLRNVVRQELIAGQLSEHVIAGSSLLDVGCGQGTQAIRQAERGCQVVGIDPSPDLLAQLRTAAGRAGVAVECHLGVVENLAPILGHRSFDVVCAHGLLMYVDDVEATIASLADRVGPGGLLSITFRNGAALAFRPGMRRQWQQAIAAFDATSYRNELGVLAVAHKLDEISSIVARCGLQLEAWYGVRVFTDPAAVAEPVDEAQFERLLDAEQAAGRRDPYRQLASQLHLLGRRPG